MTDSEYDKIKQQHYHDIWLSIYDKLFWLVVVFITGYFANIELEQFKNSLSERHYYLNKQETHLEDLRRKYSILSNFAHNFSKDEKVWKNSGKTYSLYRDALDEFSVETNASARLYSEEFHRYLQQHLWFHQAISEQRVVLNSSHRQLLIWMSNDFGVLTDSAELKKRIFVTETYRKHQATIPDLNHQMIFMSEQQTGIHGSARMFKMLHDQLKTRSAQ